MSETISGERLLGLAEVKARVGLGHTSIYGRMAAGQFPMSRRLGAHRTAWLESEIDAWIGSLPRGVGERPGAAKSSAKSGRA